MHPLFIILFSNLLGSKLCGSTNPDPVVSSGNSMTLLFRSDESVTNDGFQIVVEPGRI